MEIKYKLQQIYPKVWLLEADKFDLAMLFFRVQEYFENPKYKNKNVSFFEIMRWYSNQHNGIFSYADDYVGFNVSSKVLNRFFESCSNITEYDNVFYCIYDYLHAMDIPPYYLIGAVQGDKDTLNHELAHAFYYLYPKYRKSVNALISELPEFIIKKMEKELKEYKYHRSVFKDEIHAYCVSKAPTEIEKILKNRRIPFRKNFNDFKKNLICEK